MGKSQARELARGIAVIMVHLMKLEASPATEPRAGWRETVRRERDEVGQLLDDASSLRAWVPAIIADKISRSTAEAVASLADNGETPRRDIAGISYTEAQILRDWLP